MISLDETDLRLLELLQDDASRSNQDLAAAVDVSPATGLRRVRRLLETGVIERRVALLSPSVVGGLQVLVEVQLDRQGVEHLDAYEAIAVADAAVQQCWRVSPGPDFMLVLWVADMVAYNATADAPVHAAGQRAQREDFLCDETREVRAARIDVRRSLQQLPVP